MTENQAAVLRGEILPPEGRELRVPAGTPLGLGILGAMKFNAIRRVIDQYERALRSKEAAIEAEAAVARAIIRRELAREQLLALDLLRRNERERIEAGIAAEQMRRRLELMELEERLAEAEERRSERAKPPKETPNESTTENNENKDDFTAFMNDLTKLPGIVAAVAAAKAQIAKDAGGEEKLSESARQACDLLDAMMQSFMSKKAGDAAL